MATQIATIHESAEAQRFGLMQRQARMFAASPLVPKHLRDGSPDQAMANCYIAMTIADRMGEDRMTVMQNIHIVHGTAGFKASYMIARANASGVFKDGIDWEIEGQGKDLIVTAFATLAKTGKRVEMPVSMAMAEAEKWTSNSKYRTMPEIMLRYRSATFLVRMYAPHVMLGYQTADEIEDVVIAVSAAANSAPALTAALIESNGEGDDNAADGQGSADDQRGEAQSLEGALAEIASAEIVADVNSRASALLPLLNDDDGDLLREAASARIAELKANA